MISKSMTWQFFLVLLSPSALFGQEPNQYLKTVPQLEALCHYEGTWDSEFTVVSHDQGSINEKFTGKVEAKWVVGGRFLEQTGTYILDSASPPLVIKTLMTFDVNDQEYKYHFFDSSGEHQESTGKWDPEKKTMTSIMKESDGSVMTTVADFSQPGVENWTIEIKNAKQNSITNVTGKNTREMK